MSEHAAADRIGPEPAAVRLRRVPLTPVVTAILAALVLAVIALGSEQLQSTTIEMLINVVIVVGLYTFVGNSGVLSFGHISFMAVGAYASALVTIPLVTKATLLPDLPAFLADASLGMVGAALVAGGAAMLLAVVAGVAIVRLNGIQAAIATFSMLVIVGVVLSQWRELTRGEMTMTGVPISLGVIGPLAWALVAIGIAYLYEESRFGFRLRATREDELSARALGISVGRERFVAFVISAFLVGVGGHLYAHLVGSFSPDQFFLDVTFATIAMLIIGGRNSLAGAILGPVVVSIFLELVRRGEEGVDVGGLALSLPDETQNVAFALVTLIVLIIRPNGLVGRRFS